MSRPEILKVWGKADDIDLNFEKVGAEWQCSVPPDTEDGAYACQLNAVNAMGNYGFWTGFLYMCSGICHFELYPVDYRLFFDEVCSEIIEYSELQPRIVFDRRCPHV